MYLTECTMLMGVSNVLGCQRSWHNVEYTEILSTNKIIYYRVYVTAL